MSQQPQPQLLLLQPQPQLLQPQFPPPQKSRMMIMMIQRLPLLLFPQSMFLTLSPYTCFDPGPAVYGCCAGPLSGCGTEENSSRPSAPSYVRPTGAVTLKGGSYVREFYR